MQHSKGALRFRRAGTHAILAPRLLTVGRSTTLRCEATAKVCVKLPLATKFGESVAIVGSVPTLGSWNAEKAKPLTWTEPNIWTTEVEFPTGVDVEYKYILKSSGDVTWQDCPNMVLTFPDGTLAAEVSDTWQGVHESMQVTRPTETVEVSAPPAETSTAPSETVDKIAETAEIAAAAVPETQPAEGSRTNAEEQEQEQEQVQQVPGVKDNSEASNILPVAGLLEKSKEQDQAAAKGGLGLLGILSMLGLGSTTAVALFYMSSHQMPEALPVIDAESLQAHASTLHAQASSQLQAGASQLQAHATQLQAHASQLSSQASQLLSGVSDGLDTSL